MIRITIDGKPVECREGIPVLQAALEAGWNVPHYCYHPGLSIVASCRLCLMEMKLPDPRTKELAWVPKLFPSCQTPVKDGMEVRFASEFVEQNQKHVMEYYLLNHPLDCPVCDKAGECSLQDYSEDFGNASSRMVEEKHKNPKKDIGSRTLLYQDRCVLCTRCVRFAGEVAGTGELTVVDRGNRAEIDVFPGVPLENELQGNVVDLCPVGALLSKDFLFQQRVWLLEHTPSVSPADSGGATIWIDHNEQGIHRIRPRFNERANEWWISDEQRFSWRYVDSPNRLDRPVVRRGAALEPVRWEELPEIVRFRLKQAGEAGDVAVILSPMLSCEEAWLLGRAVRAVAPRATLVLGHVPVVGADRKFPKGFVIRAEKCPNRRGIERVIAALGGANTTFDQFVHTADRFQAAYLTAGYPETWLSAEAARSIAKIPTLMVHDLFAGPLDDAAAVRIPAAPWVEREGVFVNFDGLVQAFDRVRPPLEGVKAEGQFFHELAGECGLFRAKKTRAAMAESIPEMAQPFEPRPLPEHAH